MEPYFSNLSDINAGVCVCVCVCMCMCMCMYLCVFVQKFVYLYFRCVIHFRYSRNEICVTHQELNF